MSLQVSDLLRIGCLVVVGDQAYHCCVIGKRNDGVGVVPGHVVMLLHLHRLLFGVLGWVSVQHFATSADVRRAL